MSLERGREPPVNRLHKIQVTLLNLPRDSLEATPQHHDFGRGKTDQELFGRCIGFLFQCRIGNYLRIQQLRVWQKIAVLVVGKYVERRHVRITAVARVITRARYRCFVWVGVCVHRIFYVFVRCVYGAKGIASCAGGIVSGNDGRVPSRAG